MDYRTIVFNAARDGNLRRLKVFLDERSGGETRALLTALTFNTPPLVIAARNGHYAVVEYLLHQGADWSLCGTVTFDGETIEAAPAIWAAAAAGHFEILKLLVDNGADVNQTSGTNSSALRGACFDGHLRIVRYLIEHGADVEIANRHGHTPLMIAAYRNKIDVVRYLLTVKADVNRQSFRGNTCVHDAAEAGSVAIIKLLLAAGANVQRDHHGMTPMLAAALLGHCTVVEFFTSHSSSTMYDSCEALKLLGATCLDKCRDASAAIGYWRRAVKLEHELRLKNQLKRQPFRVPDVYGGAIEISSQADLNELISDPDALRMQALIIRERVLGIKHPDTFYYLRYRGAIYADVGRYDRCFDLWMHALRLQQSVLQPLNMMTQATLTAFAEIFSFMIHDYVTAANESGLQQSDNLPTFDRIMDVLDATVEELRRHVQGETVPCGLSLDEYSHQQTCDDCTPKDVPECIGRLTMTALFLCTLTERLLHDKSGKTNDSADSESENMQRDRMMRALYKLVRLNAFGPRQQTVLHMACSEQGTSGGRYTVAKVPSLYVVDLLLKVGADVNALDENLCSPLHLVLMNRKLRLTIAAHLIEHGAHLDQRCSIAPNRLTPLELLKLSQIGQALIPSRIQHQTLRCLAAATIQRHRLEYKTLVPDSLHTFVSLH